MKHLGQAIWDRLYPLLELEHRSFASYIVDDLIDLIKVKTELPGYVGKWVGTEHEKSAYSGIETEQETKRKYSESNDGKSV